MNAHRVSYEKNGLASPCHYPDCTSPAVKTCRKCHQSFCDQHIQRRWWRYICEFCLLLKAAENTTPEREVSTDIELFREQPHPTP